MLLRFLRFLVASTAIALIPVALAQEASDDAKPRAPTADGPADAAGTGGERVSTEVTPLPKPDASSAPTAPKQAEPSAREVRNAREVESGIASIYAPDLEGNLTASGERYDSQKLTAAHRSLPLGSRIRVTDPASGKSVSVVVNDRWGGGPGQVVNLSRRAADVLGMQSVGQRKVELEVESIGDGRRQPAPQGYSGTPQALPERVEATSSSYSARARSCANEADILGLREALLEIHVRNCLGRKSKSTTPAGSAAMR